MPTSVGGAAGSCSHSCKALPYIHSQFRRCHSQPGGSQELIRAQEEQLALEKARQRRQRGTELVEARAEIAHRESQQLAEQVRRESHQLPERERHLLVAGGARGSPPHPVRSASAAAAHPAQLPLLLQPAPPVGSLARTLPLACARIGLEWEGAKVKARV